MRMGAGNEGCRHGVYTMRRSKGGFCRGTSLEGPGYRGYNTNGLEERRSLNLESEILSSPRRNRSLTYVPVILHERLGNWARQLRPGCTSRRSAGLRRARRKTWTNVLTGLCSPVVLIDLGERLAAGLADLDRVVQRASDARILVLDPESRDEVACLARELGATHRHQDSCHRRSWPVCSLAGLPWPSVISVRMAGPEPRFRKPKRCPGAGWQLIWVTRKTSTQRQRRDAKAQ